MCKNIIFLFYLPTVLNVLFVKNELKIHFNGSFEKFLCSEILLRKYFEQE